VSELAYLVIREGGKWNDVFRLVPGQAVTIGRAPTNQIVIRDERCSRNHVEVFYSAGQWTLRDLDSRNGTIVGNQRIKGDWLLHPGDNIRIGGSQLVFVYRLAEAFSDSSAVVRPAEVEKPPAAALPGGDDSHVLGACGPATIMHRRGQTRLLEPREEEEEEPGAS
jgi:predicted component of type VI protein secretion system